MCLEGEVRLRRSDCGKSLMLWSFPPFTNTCPNTETTLFGFFWNHGFSGSNDTQMWFVNVQVGCQSVGIATLHVLVLWCVCWPVGHHFVVMNNSIFAAGLPVEPSWLTSLERAAQLSEIEGVDIVLAKAAHELWGLGHVFKGKLCFSKIHCG